MAIAGCAPKPDSLTPDTPIAEFEAPLAMCLASWAADADTVFIARSEARMGRLMWPLAGLCAGRTKLLALPPWDVLPYNRVAPSAAIVGQRIATLIRLGIRLGEAGPLPRLLITSAEAVLQRVPPRDGWAVPVVLQAGAEVDTEALRHAVAALGYHHGESVSEAGEAAFRGQVIDVYPADAPAPVRVKVEDGRIAAMHSFDPATQRRKPGALQIVRLLPATEFPLDPSEADQSAAGDDTPLVLPSGRLVPVFERLDGCWTGGVAEAWAALHETAWDAYEANRRLHRSRADGLVLPRPDWLFLTPARAAERCRAAVEALPEVVPEAAARAGVGGAGGCGGCARGDCDAWECEGPCGEPG